MKLTAPSIELLLNGFVKTVKRFPMPFLFALLGTYAAVQNSLLDYNDDKSLWIKLILCSNLGLAYSLAANTFVNSKSWKPYWLNIFRLLIVGFLLLYYFTLPDIPLPSMAYRFALLSIIGHLLVSVAPFSSQKHINGFWQYNKTLFLRFLTSALYSAVLFAGLAVAMLALEELFGINIDGDRYFQLWLIIVGVFNTCMFLAGVPESPLFLDDDRSYPKSLKVFTQYVLIPLVSLYVLILFAYELKILISWELPRGWVSNLIIAFAVFGILSLLLIFPIRKQSENKWIGLYSKVFYWTVLPLLVLLFLAIITRISDYGFTEERLFILMAGIWLAFIAVYFIFSKQENIKLIPASLIVVVVITAICVRPLVISSQQARLKTILLSNKMLENGRILKAQKEISDDDRLEITLITKYLYENHGTSAVQPFFTEKINTPYSPYGYHGFIDSLFKTVNIKPLYYKSSSERSNRRYVNLRLDKQFPISTSGYDYFADEIQPINGFSEFSIGDSHFTSKINEDSFTLVIGINGKDSININLKPLLTKMTDLYLDDGIYKIKSENASVVAENQQFKIKVFVNSFNGNLLEEKQLDKKNYGLMLTYLVKLKN